MALATVRIVLVEPAGPLNVGSVARVMKNMGFTQLVLVNPQCDRLGAEARQMAVHASDVLETAQEVMTLPEALQGCQRAIATTGRSTTLNIPLESPRDALPWLLEGNLLAGNLTADHPTPVALIFGREDRGLTNEELNYAQRFVQIPTDIAYTSLNLAQAVAICCYELHTWATRQTAGKGNRQWHDGASIHSSEGAIDPPLFTAPTDLAPLDALEGYYQQLESLLLKIGYLYPHTAASRMEKFRRLLHRAYPSTTEVAMLRGILRQVEWALTNKRQE